MNLLIAKLQMVALQAIILPMGNNGPHVNPSYHGPGMSQGKTLLAWFLGLLVLASAAIFFFCLFKIGASFAGDSKGGAGKAVTGAVVALIIGGLLAAGTQTYYGWSNFFS
jgi:hypothetical protein